MNSELLLANFTCSSHLFLSFHFYTSFFWIKFLHSTPFKTHIEGHKRCTCSSILQSQPNTETERQDCEPLFGQQLPFPISRCNYSPSVATKKHTLRSAIQAARSTAAAYKKGPVSTITLIPRRQNALFYCPQAPVQCARGVNKVTQLC